MGKFPAYTWLNHAGDFPAAASELSLLGYGDELDIPSGIDISGIIDSDPQEEEDVFPVAPEMPAELLDCPGMIGELAKWINETSPKPQPVLALGASIAAVATVIGRKVRLESGLRPNLYVLGVAPTGAGKERARQAIRSVFDAVGIGDLCGYDDIASDAGIVTALQGSPSCLFMLDEFGRILKLMASDRAPAHIANQVSAYLRLYGASEGRFHGKTYADKDKAVVIDQPSLCIYGTTVPGRLHAAMSSDQVSDGLLSRFLVFESTGIEPRYVPIVQQGPPDGLLNKLSAWAEMTNGGNLEDEFADPAIVPESKRAKGVFMDMEDELYAKRLEISKQGGEPGLFTRVGTAARKLAMIQACGINSARPEVTDECATWGVKLAMHLTDNLAEKVRDRVSDNDTEAAVKKIGLVIRSSKNGLSRGILVRQTQTMPRKARSDAVMTLMESGQIVLGEDGKLVWADDTGA